MRDFSKDHRWLSINTATVRKSRGQDLPLTDILDACARHGIQAISPWRDQVAAAGLQATATRLREHGLEAVLQPQYRERYVWRQWGAVAVVFALALTGVIAAGLWHLNREPVYGYFALCAPFGMLRFGDRLWSTSPLGWPVWGGIVALSLAVHVLLLVRFSLALIGRDGLGARRAFWVLLLIRFGARLFRRNVLKSGGGKRGLIAGLFAKS